MSEYYDSSVGGCYGSYASLGNYNATTAGSMTGPPISPTVTSGIYVVPSYSPSSGPLSMTAQCVKQPDGTCKYNPSASAGCGYGSITWAYGPGAENCGTQYSTLSCGGTKMRRGS